MVSIFFFFAINPWQFWFWSNSCILIYLFYFIFLLLCVSQEVQSHITFWGGKCNQEKLIKGGLACPSDEKRGLLN